MKKYKKAVYRTAKPPNRLHRYFVRWKARFSSVRIFQKVSRKYRGIRKKEILLPLFVRILTVAVVLLLVFLLFCLPCAAEQSSVLPKEAQEYYTEQLDGSGANRLPDKLPEETQKQLAGLGVDTDNLQTVGGLTPKSFFSTVFGIAGTEGKGPLKAAGMCLGVILLCALVNSMKLSFGDRPLGGVAGVVAALCICICVVEPIVEVLVRATSVIKTACGFTLAAVPVAAAILAALGRPASAASMQIMLTTAGNVVQVLSACVFAPGLKIYLAMAIVSSISPDINLSGICRFFSKAVKWLLGLSMTLFTGLLGMRQLVSTGADNLTARAARFVVSSAVPVVGSALSDALHTVAGCVEMLRSGVGAFVLLALLILFLPVVLSCLLWMLTLHACAAVSEVFSLKEVSTMLRSCSMVLEVLLAILLCSMTVLIVSSVVLVSMGGGGTA